MCVLYMGLGSNGFFMAGAALTGVLQILIYSQVHELFAI